MSITEVDVNGQFKNVYQSKCCCDSQNDNCELKPLGIQEAMLRGIIQNV